jgi:hypothetical protein
MTEQAGEESINDEGGDELRSDENEQVADEMMSDEHKQDDMTEQAGEESINDEGGDELRSDENEQVADEMMSDEHKQDDMTEQAGEESIDDEGGDELDDEQVADDESSDEDKQDDELGSPRKHAIIQARAKRTRFQIKQADYMKKRYMESLRPVSVGSLVTLKTDNRDAVHPNGIPAIVYKVSKSGEGIYAATQVGIISSSRKPYFIPRQRYVVQDSDVPIDTKLEEIRKLILSGEYNISTVKKISWTDAHQGIHGYGRPLRRCHCASGSCGKRCGCRKANVPCTNECSCRGNCIAAAAVGAAAAALK